MTKELDKNESALPEKLLIDKPSDFQFHAAYLAYSDIYDRTDSLEAKEQLNQNIKALQQNQIDYATFYRNINQFRTESNAQHRYDRATIKTQRKKDWRRQAERRERNKRHRR